MFWGKVLRLGMLIGTPLAKGVLCNTCMQYTSLLIVSAQFWVSGQCCHDQKWSEICVCFHDFGRHSLEEIVRGCRGRDSYVCMSNRGRQAFNGCTVTESLGRTGSLCTRRIPRRTLWSSCTDGIGPEGLAAEEQTNLPHCAPSRCRSCTRTTHSLRALRFMALRTSGESDDGRLGDGRKGMRSPEYWIGGPT